MRFQTDRVVFKEMIDVGEAVELLAPELTAESSAERFHTADLLERVVGFRL